MNFFRTINTTKSVIISLLIFILLFASHVAYTYLGENFHTVIPHKVYRSAQLNTVEFYYYVKRYHIKSILNLRGKNSNNRWYRNEVALSKRLNISHYDLKLAAHKLPSKKELSELVSILQAAPKPLLLHCKNGADRSGLAAGISVILSNDRSMDDLKDQMSWQYNALSPKTVGFQVMKNYFSWLKKSHVDNSRDSFLQWMHAGTRLKNYSGWFIT